MRITLNFFDIYYNYHEPDGKRKYFENAFTSE